MPGHWAGFNAAFVLALGTASINPSVVQPRNRCCGPDLNMQAVVAAQTFRNHFFLYMNQTTRYIIVIKAIANKRDAFIGLASGVKTLS